MVIVKSLLMGYLGAMLAGVLVGIGGAIVEAPPAVVASAASPVGVAVGLMAFSVVWWRPLAARLARARVSRRR